MKSSCSMKLSSDHRNDQHGRLALSPDLSSSYLYMRLIRYVSDISFCITVEKCNEMLKDGETL